MEKIVLSDVTGTVWKIEMTDADSVETDDVIMIIESMKMEIPVVAPMKGTILKILVSEGTQVSEGQPLVELSA